VTDHDDESDDPQLKSLRAVWLAMPDEDPPERGLAELMAAARVKAEDMARPSLWQRVAAVLRRPPVLALATVLVLIGGAVFIGQRHEKLEAPPPSVEQPARLEQPAPTVAPVAAGSASIEENREKQDEAAPAAEPEQPPPAPERSTGALAPKAPPREKAPVAHKAGDTKAAPKLQANPSSTSSMDFEAPQATKGEAKPATKGEAKPADKTTVAKPEPRAGAATRGATMDLGGKTDSFAAPEAAPEGATAQALTEAPVNASQHVQQAKVAAARGDCPTARKLMKRVASEDAAAYRKALASDAALKKCFE
jgi:hypothetical protein